MPKKVTIHLIAARARVGTATVERVLNGRGGVRPETVEKVIAAARRLDYPRRLPDAHRGVLRIEVILVRPESAFFGRLSKAFERIAATLDSSIAVHRTFLDEDKPEAIAAHIARPSLRRSALILAVPEHAAIRAALSKLMSAGTPVIQIVTRMRGLGSDYVGIDNEAAGRMAGLLMCGLQRRPGTVVAFCHSGVYAVHRDRVRGFSDYLSRQPAPHLVFSQAAFTHDDEMVARERTLEIISAYPDLAGLYNVGGVNSAICESLRHAARGRGICFIGHELNAESSGALKDGTMAAVIDQAPETQARRALDMALSKLGLLKTAVDPAPIRFITVTPENL